VAAVLAAALLFTACTAKRKGEPAEPAAYVGSEACQECHQEVYLGWKTTFHAYKFREPSPDFVIGDFERNNTITAAQGPITMSRKGDEYFVTAPGPESRPETYRVDYVLGSIWKQRYISRFPNGALRVLPVQWNVQTLKWVGASGMEGEGAGKAFWSDSENVFQYQCMGCHTTNSRANYDEAKDTYATEWTDMGVGCEGCHGPGSNHLVAEIPEKAATILNPAKMPDPRRAAMICGSCHGRGKSLDGKYAYPVDYHPGGQLNFLFDQQPGTFPDGSAKQHHQQYDDWLKSGHARGGTMCWDCHSPHLRGKSNRFQLKLPGSLLCNSCHKVEPRGVHGLHSVNNCVGCHMPNTVYSATPGDLRSHSFMVVRPVVAEPGEEQLDHFLLAAKKPDSCKQCHYHEDEDLE
jgi:predicted CXXCH cytochrome family protein